MKDKKLTLNELASVVGGVDAIKSVTPEVYNLAPPSASDIKCRYDNMIKMMAEIDKKYPNKTGVAPLPKEVQEHLNKVLSIH